MVMRKMSSISHTVYLVKNNDEYEWHTDSAVKNKVIKFKLGEEFDEETIDGRKAKSVVTLDGGKMNHTQKGEKEVFTIREFTETELIVTSTYKGLTCKRFYKVAN